MCQKCLDAVNKYYPGLDDEERGELLMSATAFPFGTPEMLEKQLSELVEKTDGSLGAAIEFADRRLDEQLT